MKDSLGDRMKNLEGALKTKVVPNTPLIIRIDGRSFHSWTKQIPRFNDKLSIAMAATMQALCNQISGAKIGFTQSDEISIICFDPNPMAEPFFGGGVQKLTSVCASIATATFNNVHGFENKPLATFDARVFNVPEFEVSNYLIWRQKDAQRNFVQTLARIHFSHKQVHGLSNVELLQKLEEQDIREEDFDSSFKNGLWMFKIPDPEARPRWSNIVEAENFLYNRHQIKDILNGVRQQKADAESVEDVGPG